MLIDQAVLKNLFSYRWSRSEIALVNVLDEPEGRDVLVHDIIDTDSVKLFCIIYQPLFKWYW